MVSERVNAGLFQLSLSVCVALSNVVLPVLDPVGEKCVTFHGIALSLGAGVISLARVCRRSLAYGRSCCNTLRGNVCFYLSAFLPLNTNTRPFVDTIIHWRN